MGNPLLTTPMEVKTRKKKGLSHHFEFPLAAVCLPAIAEAGGKKN